MRELLPHLDARPLTLLPRRRLLPGLPRLSAALCPNTIITIRTRHDSRLSRSNVE